MRVLILGARYGALIASKVLLAGHDVALVCRTDERRRIDATGLRVSFPARRDRPGCVLDSRRISGRLSTLDTVAAADTAADLVVVAVQEPQCADPQMQRLLGSVARSGAPTVTVTNMPPPPYLARVAPLSPRDMVACYSSLDAWQSFHASAITHCSPDPQAVLIDDDTHHRVRVGLASNFKIAPFQSGRHTAILQRLARDIRRARGPDGAVVPVQLTVTASAFVPLAKWPMLIAGNYRCVRERSERSIFDALHDDLPLSRSLYRWSASVCQAMGASPDDLVDESAYLRAAERLTAPSSVARACAAGAANIERVDLLFQRLAAGANMAHPALDDIVRTIDARLAANRRGDPVAGASAH